ncbi:MAG: YhcH/YjgK/YiaL family protein [Clostridia bacterium]
MYKGHINFLSDDALPPIVKEALRYLLTLQKDKLPAQSYTLGESGVFVNFANTVTSPESERVFEAHEKYADLHFVVEGTERIDLGWTKSMQQSKPYEEADDTALYQGTPHTRSVMTVGEFLLCMPGEAHRVLVAPNESAPIQKAIAKIPVSLLW